MFSPILIGGVGMHKMIKAGEQVVDARVEHLENEDSKVRHLVSCRRNVADDHGGNNKGL